MSVVQARSRWQHYSDSLLCRLIPLCLLIDCINGALLQQQGSSYGLSVFYKIGVLALMAFATVLYRPVWALGFLLMLMAMLIGPAWHWPQLATSWMLADIQLAVKALSPLLAFCYLLALQKRQPQSAQRVFWQTLQLSAVVLLLNALAGAAGLGFTAYQPLEGVAQAFLGIKGFFYSTNELSAVLLVITAALLCVSWPRYKAAFIGVSVLAFMLALSMLTKTGLFGVVLLVLLVPLLMQHAAFWRGKKHVLLLVGGMALLLFLAVLANAETLLKLLGMYDKLSFVYHQRGISGIALSSRDYYAGRIWQSLTEHYSHWQQLLGVGQGGIALYLKKYFAELDWFDLLIFYGVAGLVTWGLTFAVFIRHSVKHCYNGIGRVILMLNLLLLLVSSVAGHILTSGMLWLPWALCNALLLTAHQRRDDERHS
ncbi:O-antigen ligase family protein [Rheinheimera maricola]|uniref:O-antigen ligase family protein n=1 Tax=Rheinheimera maricola TaxID=2793282 RepID=A0ABS7X4E6_9GAMM|nr:O-antigen ligase family protein [Rheinheimera maricola]MBZ9610414.1 O-antigen ligase family protein [Rheinheimera maricola]